MKLKLEFTTKDIVDMIRYGAKGNCPSIDLSVYNRVLQGNGSIVSAHLVLEIEN